MKFDYTKLSRDEYLYFSLKYNGNWNQITQAFIKKEKEKIDYAFLDNMKPLLGNYITIRDDNYPEMLKNIDNPPFVIFYKGNLNLLKVSKSVAIVGTNKRISSSESINKIKDYVETFDKLDIIHVSSLEEGTGVGCLAQVFSAYADEPIPSIAVCCGGIDYTNKLPTFINKQLEETSLILSEYPLSIKPTDEMKQKSKRIVTAVAKKVLFLEVDHQYNTADKIYAKYQKKDIVADITSNDLAKRMVIDIGAIPVASALDVASLFDEEPPEFECYLG